MHISQDGAPLLLATATATAAAAEAAEAAQPRHAAQVDSSSTPQVAAEHRPAQAPVPRKWNVEGVVCRVGIGVRAEAASRLCPGPDLRWKQAVSQWAWKDCPCFGFIFLRESPFVAEHWGGAASGSWSDWSIRQP